MSEKIEQLEKIYTGSTLDDENSTFNTINSFLSEVIARKREDNIEGGFQASGVIKPDKYAFKVNEKDGTDYHEVTRANLNNFLDGLPFVSSLIKLYTGDAPKHKSCNVAIICGEEKLTVSVIATDSIDIARFKVVFKALLDNLMLLLANKRINTISLGIITDSFEIETMDLSFGEYEEALKRLGYNIDDDVFIQLKPFIDQEREKYLFQTEDLINNITREYKEYKGNHFVALALYIKAMSALLKQIDYFIATSDDFKNSERFQELEVMLKKIREFPKEVNCENSEYLKVQVDEYVNSISSKKI